MSVAAEEWSGEDTTIAQIERELVRLRAEATFPGGGGNQRTSVMTHCAWAPPEWVDAAETTLAGLADRHPSRTILLMPHADEPDGLDADLSLRCFAAGDRRVCSEVIALRLRGRRADAPASIVLPLLISDLPVFCRWRGEPPFGEPPWEQLIDLADRVIVDSGEWESLRYDELSAAFSRTAVSDIAWARLEDWRVELAGRWPEIAEQEIHVAGPPAEAALLRGWLATRLSRTVNPVTDAAELSVRLGGEEIRPPRPGRRSPSDLLSGELDRFTRDPVYEAAVTGA